MKSLIVILMLAAVAWQSADAIRCYKCNSGTSGSCTSGYNVMTTCTGATCFTATGTYAGVSVVVRDCSGGSAPTTCVDYTYSGITGRACYCFTDLCNGNGAMQADTTPYYPYYGASAATTVSFSRLMVGFVAVALIKTIVG